MNSLYSHSSFWLVHVNLVIVNESMLMKFVVIVDGATAGSCLCKMSFDIPLYL